MKFTDEELSRVLSQHAVRGMQRFGIYNGKNDLPCLIQTARASERTLYYNYKLLDKGAMSVANAFDDDYDRTWTTDQFITWMIKQDLL